jgi:hypothetical protein
MPPSALERSCSDGHMCEAEIRSCATKRIDRQHNTPKIELPQNTTTVPRIYSLHSFFIVAFDFLYLTARLIKK